MLIVYCEKGQGWAPISYMVQLAADLLGSDLIILDSSTPSFFQKLESFLVSRKNNASGDSVLLVCPTPSDMQLLLHFKGWHKRFHYVGAWIIDSFWTGWIPHFAKVKGFFDHIFVTTEEDIPDWQMITKSSVSWLPWGSDTLQLNRLQHKKILDLVRVGRQPTEWDDNDATSRLCQQRKISFLGSPKMYQDPVKNQLSLMEIYTKTKFVLAFSNAVNPTDYTHPQREYLTARWVDSIASGAIVAGIVPNEPSVSRQLWHGATLDLKTVDASGGLNIIEDALFAWDEEQSTINIHNALKYLDWRWRFREIVKKYELKAPKLDTELLVLERLICENDQSTNPSSTQLS